METIRMIREDGKTGDMHPNEVDRLKRFGWRVAEGQKRQDAKHEEESEGVGTDSGDQFSDEQLRAAIETATGERPHHRTGRDKLVSMFNELNKDA